MNFLTFSVLSQGVTGREWLSLLESREVCITDNAREILLSKDFKACNDKNYYLFGIIGNSPEKEFPLKNVKKLAESVKLSNTSPEVACLLIEKYNKEYFLKTGISSITVMHEPVKDSDKDPLLLSISFSEAKTILQTTYYNPELDYGRRFIFVFNK